MYKFGLIGSPISHSLSPWIHTQLLHHEKLTGNYDLIEFPPDEFNDGIQKLKSMRLDGFNITVPYKEAIIPYLDELDGSAAAVGAVNTVKEKDGKWKGYNTDGVGFVTSLKNRYPNCLHPEANVLIIGSGGAAKGIYHALLQEQIATIDLTNRTVSRAQDIIQMNRTSVSSKAFTLEEAASRMSEYDVLIQTTTVGMSPHSSNTIIEFDDVKEGSVACDIVYRPIHTEFLNRAQSLGADIHYGHEMLLFQAVYAFQIWTGTNPKAYELLEEFEKQLKGV